MPKIQLFEVDDGYIQYLQQFDNKVLNHYGTNYVKSRKYLGVLISINNCDYVAPLSSPNPKTDYDNGVIRKSIIPIIRIVKLGKKLNYLGQ
ncbi:type III toxin-antitoxin system ToxN/AbiQ family toxin [Fusobacterium simiae]|uniref:type III toxin-antitoxin system ToxN/AbiQ family toxin n=1 Tax=Fusobacterium TaxID=848 RepID=UPI0020C1DF44|nr:MULTISPECIES: type III toxin-antitoxin system ToxN/AbiQ family toxin [Fusobacterium]MDC7955640.1 type III toxin-antitoxin system ToxN/AbiQ family toxin [Fusobacterium simiae]